MCNHPQRTVEFIRYIGTTALFLPCFGLHLQLRVAFRQPFDPAGLRWPVSRQFSAPTRLIGSPLRMQSFLPCENHYSRGLHRQTASVNLHTWLILEMPRRPALFSTPGSCRRR